MSNEPTITQADRDAAWFIRPDWYGKSEYDNWRLGVYDGSRCIQALAEHREAAVAELQAEVERLREALEYYAENDHYDHGDVPGHIYVIDDHGGTARAVLAQKERVMTSEIKPCPFCGTSMVVVTKDTFSHPGTVGDGKCLMAGKGYYWEHINWWNTRAGEPVAEIDE